MKFSTVMWWWNNLVKCNAVYISFEDGCISVSYSPMFSSQFGAFKFHMFKYSTHPSVDIQIFTCLSKIYIYIPLNIKFRKYSSPIKIKYIFRIQLVSCCKIIYYEIVSNWSLEAAVFSASKIMQIREIVLLAWWSKEDKSLVDYHPYLGWLAKNGDRNRYPISIK